MSLRDHYSGFKFFQAIEPQSTDTAITGVDIDTQGYETLTLIANVGNVSGTTSASHWVFLLAHASASTAGGAGTYSYCASIDMIRTVSTAVTNGNWASTWSADGGSQTYMVGYRGSRRYVRVIMSNYGTTPSLIVFGVVALLGDPANWPVNAV